MHMAELKALAGSSDNFSTSVCELAHKPIAKSKQSLTNNQRKFLGLNLLKTNLRATVSRMLCQRLAAASNRDVWLDPTTGKEIRADRHYVRFKEPKGCAAIGLRANIMERAMDNSARWHRLGGGGKGGRNTLPKRGFRIADFAKGTPAHQRAGTVPWFLRKHPHLGVLPKKLARFFNYYLPGAFRSLN